MAEAKSKSTEQTTEPHDVKGGTTKGAGFTEAAAVATPDDGQGYVGTSPEADRTGRRDKGLSQRNPAILTGGPIPDARPRVDDTEGLAALKAQG